VVGETYLGSAVSPQHVDRDEGLGEVWHAAYVPDEYSAFAPVCVGGHDGQITYA
jgi:hypothetical protein